MTNSTNSNDSLNNPQSSCSYDSIISLLSIYENEWAHRDQLLWSQTFKFFYLSIIVMFLPNISTHFQISLPPIPPKLFPMVGILFSTISFYVSLGYGKRLECSSKSCEKLINLLPEQFKTVKIEEIKNGKLYSPRFAYIIPIILYIILMLIGVFLLYV